MKPFINIKSLARYLAILSLIVLLVLSLLMILNFFQIKSHNPVAGNTIDQLVSRLEAGEDDQLREQIRALDLLARKAYFSSLWQLKTGAWLLVGFGLLFIVSIKIYTTQSQIPGVEDTAQEHFWAVKSRERHWLLYGAGSLLLVALVLSFSTRAYYTDFRQSPSKNLSAGATRAQLQDDADSPADFPQIEEILQQHPSFRGPFGLGISHHKQLPEEWDAASGNNILWKTALELPGLNSPIVWGERVFLGGADENTQKLFCYDIQTGDLIWERTVSDVPGSPAVSPKVTDDTGYSASGLTCDGKRVYAIFANGDLVCYDTEGELVWSLNLGQPDNHYGHSSSLQFYQDKLIVQLDDNNACRLIAIAARTGKTIWDITREGEISWSSPIVIANENGAQIVVNNLPFVAAYNIEDGKELWKADCLSGEIGPSPAYGNGMVFVANEYAKMIALKDGEIVWETYDFLPDVSSPVAYENYLFCATSYGDLVCLNQEDGSILWQHEFDNGFYGSPMVADGKVFCTDRAGNTVIIEAGPEFRLIAQAAINERSDATPAFADGKIFIRGYQHLFCIGNK